MVGDNRFWSLFSSVDRVTSAPDASSVGKEDGGAEKDGI